MAKSYSYIVNAKRSPIGRFLGSLSKMPAAKIGAAVATKLLDETRADRTAIDDVFIGQVLQAGSGQNPARQVALGAGISDLVSAVTINKVCGSGLQSVMFADMAIRAGDANLVLAGGIESMSLAPFLSHAMRGGHKFGNVEFVDSMMHDGLTNIYDGEIMGVIAEETATRAGVTRAQQDDWALKSHQRAAAADKAGLFNAERITIELGREKTPFNSDETIRADATLAALGGLKAAFGGNGTITAGNASAISDGAAMLLVASDQGLKKCVNPPLGRIVASATSGGPPRDLFFAPIKAIQQVCEKAGWERSSVDLFEMNEAFAAQMIACMKGLELSGENVNVHGGAIALGHPIGASGARVLTTLVHAMKARGAKRGIASLCLGGGNAVALAVEAV